MGYGQHDDLIAAYGALIAYREDATRDDDAAVFERARLAILDAAQVVRGTEGEELQRRLGEYVSQLSAMGL